MPRFRFDREYYFIIKSWVTLFAKILIMEVKTPLFEFIDDFKLRQVGKGVCFDAAVHFNNAENTIIIQAEVHVVGIKAKEINTVYLIPSMTVSEEVPDMFNDQTEKFEYKKNECLVIAGSSKTYHNYTISIYPENNICDNDIFKKAKSK